VLETAVHLLRLTFSLEAVPSHTRMTPIRQCTTTCQSCFPGQGFARPQLVRTTLNPAPLSHRSFSLCALCASQSRSFPRTAVGNTSRLSSAPLVMFSREPCARSRGFGRTTPGTESLCRTPPMRPSIIQAISRVRQGGQLLSSDFERAGTACQAPTTRCSHSSIEHTPRGREPPSGAGLNAEAEIRLGRVPDLHPGCLAALNIYHLASPQYAGPFQHLPPPLDKLDKLHKLDKLPAKPYSKHLPSVLASLPPPVSDVPASLSWEGPRVSSLPATGLVADTVRDRVGICRCAERQADAALCHDTHRRCSFASDVPMFRCCTGWVPAARAIMMKCAPIALCPGRTCDSDHVCLSDRWVHIESPPTHPRTPPVRHSPKMSPKRALVLICNAGSIQLTEI
jgi:hypothetical protein